LEFRAEGNAKDSDERLYGKIPESDKEIFSRKESVEIDII
jgi:hypothetical protein